MTETTNQTSALPAELVKLIQILDEKKARDLQVLHIGKQTVIADYFVICEGTSNTHIRSLCGDVEYRLGQDGISVSHIEGYEDGNWILMDFGAVVLHLFTKETRNYYHLEKLWQEGEVIDITPILAASEEDQ